MSFISELTSRVTHGEYIYTELALYVSKNECARTDNVYFPMFEVCDGTVSLGTASVHRSSPALSFPSTRTLLLGLPSHTSQYLCYSIVVANGGVSIRELKKEITNW